MEGRGFRIGLSPAAYRVGSRQGTSPADPVPGIIRGGLDKGKRP